MTNTAGLKIFVGPANQLEIGEVTTGPAAATLTPVTDTKQRLDLVIPAPTAELVEAAEGAQAAAAGSAGEASLAKVAAAASATEAALAKTAAQGSANAAGTAATNAAGAATVAVQVQLGTAVSAAESSAASAAASAALVGAPAGAAVLAAIGPGGAAEAALNATIIDQGTLYKRALGKFQAGLGNRLTTPCRVVCVGSSTTEGAGASTPAQRYVNRLSSAIQAAYPSGTGSEAAVVFMQNGIGAVSNTPGVHVYNGGVGGSVTSNYLTQFTDIQVAPIAALNPRLIIHMVGSNDYAAGTAPDVAAANVAGKISEFKTAIPGPCTHLVINTYARYDVVAPAYPWHLYGAEYRKLAAADPENVAFIDIHEPYDLADAGGSDPLDLMQGDKIHQTDAGYALMADLIRQGMGINSATAPAASGITAPGLRITSDSFSGANNTALTTRPTDIAYSGTAITPAETTAGVFAIVSNQLVIAPSQAFLGYPTTTQDQEISAVVITPPSAGNVYLNSRRNAMSGSVYQARAVLGQGSVRLELNGTASGDKYPYKAGDRVGVRSKGNTHALTINNIVVNTATADVPSSTYAGFASFTNGGSAAVLDDVMITAV